MSEDYLRGRRAAAEAIREEAARSTGPRRRVLLAAAELADPQDPPALARPDGKQPAEFYERVAEVYSHYAALTHAPAVAIAAATRVPIGTVHRWIKEARRLGALPPGRQGRAG